MDVPGPEILIPARSTSPTPVLRPEREDGGTGPLLCSLCLSGPGKYTCPRCNALYCSLSCYRGPRHTACSELFYRDSVLQALREEEADPSQRRRIQEMLLKLREEEATSDQATGMSGLVTGEEADLWNSLTAQEREDFHRLVKTGDIGSLVPQWKPWWETEQQGHKKIMELPEMRNAVTDIQPAQPDHNGHNISNDFPKKHGGTATQTDTRDRKGLSKPIVVLSCDQGESGFIAKTAGQDNHASGDVKEASSDVQKREISPMLCDSKDVNKESVVKEEMSSKIRHYKSSCIPQQDKKRESSVNTEDPAPREGPCGIDQCGVPQIPPLLNSIPPLTSLSRNPSPLVQFSLVNVLYSYAFSLLQHNGDLSDNDMLLNFTGTVLCVSGALTTTAVYNSTALAVKSAVRAATDPLLGGDEWGACFAIKATSTILLGDGSKRYTLAALSHLYRLLGKTRKLETEEKDIKKGAFNAKKKCLFLAAWVKENEDCLAILSAEVMSEYELYLKDISELNELSKGLQKVWGGKRPPEKKKLIQEVNLT